MDNILYQFFHPWHWLTYGQNAAALAAVATGAAFIGLLFYTLYTRRMMGLQEAALRANITPILVAQGDVEFSPLEMEYPDGADIGLQNPKATEWVAVLKIRNIGAGAAIFLRGWCQTVSAGFDSDDPTLFERTPHLQEGTCESTELSKDEKTQVTFTGFKNKSFEQRWIFVVDAIDQTDTRHQLRIVRTPRTDTLADVAVSMSHQQPGGATQARTLKRLLGVNRGGGSKS